MSWPDDGLPRFATQGPRVLDRAYCFQVVGLATSLRDAERLAARLNMPVVADVRPMTMTKSRKPILKTSTSSRGLSKPFRREEQVVVVRDVDVRRHGNRWTPALIIAAILRFVDVTGRPPTADEWKLGGPWPNYATIRRHFGSWGDAIEAAGLPRPTCGVYVVSERSQPRGVYRRRVA